LEYINELDHKKAAGMDGLPVGMDGLLAKASDLMKSYLTNRIQHTVVDNVYLTHIQSKPECLKDQR